MSIKDWKMFNRDQMGMRIFLCIIGTVICGIAVGFFRYAAFGVDPFTSMMSGLDAVVPIKYGTLYVIANAVLLLFALFADRHYIGLGTIINLFLVGYLSDFSKDILGGLLGDSLLPRIICLVIAVLLLSFSAALYMPADLGVSTYDAVALIIANTWHIGKFKYDRIITDFICVIIGSILFVIVAGNPLSALPSIAGIGTIITAFFMGPLIDFFTRIFTKKYLLKD